MVIATLYYVISILQLTSIKHSQTLQRIYLPDLTDSHPHYCFRVAWPS